MIKEKQNIWTGKDTQIIIRVIAFLVSLLWTYTGLDKLLNWKRSWKAFHNQTFPSELADSLAYAVPILELILAFMLVFQLTRWWGMMGSLLLMSIFNTYVGLVWQGAFPRVPCNCAGLLERMSWQSHFWFNSCCIIIIILGLWFWDQRNNSSVKDA